MRQYPSAFPFMRPRPKTRSSSYKSSTDVPRSIEIQLVPMQTPLWEEEASEKVGDLIGIMEKSLGSSETEDSLNSLGSNINGNTEQQQPWDCKDCPWN